MRRFHGLPTIAACGFVAAFYWAAIFGMIPSRVLTMPSTKEAVEGFKRVHEAMPNMDTFFGIREVLRKINEGIGR